MNGDDDRGRDVSPLFVGALGILAGAMVVVTLHCIASSWCKYRRLASRPRQISRLGDERQMLGHNAGTNTGTNMAQLVQVSEHCCREICCAVCLCEFEEGEVVRVLPECTHTFHAPCVDMWLFSHPNCPLCRAKATATQPQHTVVSLPDPSGVSQPEQSRAPDFWG